MIYYRFDIPKRQLHYRTEQSKEYIISFIVMYELICMLAANKAVFEELCRLSEKCYRSKKNQPVFHAYVKEYPVQKRYKRAWRFLTDAFYDFSAYHNHHFCRTLWLCFVRKYMSRNLHPQYRQMGQALHLYASGTRKEQIGKYPLYCTELDGKLYHSVEPQYLLCCSFLIEFMEAIYERVYISINARCAEHFFAALQKKHAVLIGPVKSCSATCLKTAFSTRLVESRSDLMTKSIMTGRISVI